MSFTSTLRKNAPIIFTVLLMVIVYFLIYVWNTPSGSFSEAFLDMANFVQSSITGPTPATYFQQEYNNIAAAGESVSGVVPSVDPGSAFAGTIQEVYGPAASTFASGNTSTAAELNPADLLPQANPVNFTGGENLGAKNFLSAGSLIGINTVGSSMKNPNLQLRSDPPIPQVVVSPWNQSTLGPDPYARPFEMGSSGSSIGL